MTDGNAGMPPHTIRFELFGADQMGMLHRGSVGSVGRGLLLTGLLAGAGMFVAAAPAAAQDMMMMSSNAALVRSLIPMVVNITARAEVPEDSAPLEASSSQTSSETTTYQIKTSAGSGFVIDPSGYIATNWHVVAGAYEVWVTFSDGERAKADVTNAARLVDLALLKVDVGHTLPAVKWGDSSKVQVGDPVLAIGNPLGIGISVSGGIVSALNRNIMDTPYDDFIQTDAAINHGNSGGPLFNLAGEVIGLNSAIISPTSANAGLGFALPSNDTHWVYDRLIHREYGRPGWLGVKIQQVTPDMALGLGKPDLQGSIVAWVLPGGPAEKAGLHIGDVILRLDGTVPTDERALLRMLAEGKPGTNVTLGILRAGNELTLAATLVEWPRMNWEERDGLIKAAAPHFNIPHDLGIAVMPLTPQMRAENEIVPEASGALVTGVTQNTDAARRGVRPGDVVMEVNDTPVRDSAALQEAIDQAREAKRNFALFLILPKVSAASTTKSPGPKWLALRVAADDIRD
jgi:serine protease Do